MKYVITGTSSGLGHSLTLRLLKCGQVFGISRSLVRDQSLLLNKDFIAHQHDLSESCDSDSYRKMLKELAIFLNGDQYTLVINAASFYSGSRRLRGDELNQLFQVNLFSAMHLVEDLQTDRLKRILFINSVSGLNGQRDQHEYTASKHGLMGYARSVAKVAKSSHFDVMTINPGGMKTELWNNYSDVDQSDFLCPDSIADVCMAFLLIPQRAFVESVLILPPSDV